MPVECITILLYAKIIENRQGMSRAKSIFGKFQAHNQRQKEIGYDPSVT